MSLTAKRQPIALSLRRFWVWLRFGTIREEVRSVDGGVASEVAFIGRFNRVVGYWAYGHYDPSLPYKENT